MLPVKKQFNAKESKAIIRKRLGDIEKRLTEAKNSLIMVQCLNEMTEILEAEIYAWVAQCEKSINLPAKKLELLKDEAAQHIANLQAVGDKVNTLRATLLPEALKLQQNMLNSRIIDKPLIQIPE